MIGEPSRDRLLVPGAADATYDAATADPRGLRTHECRRLRTSANQRKLHGKSVSPALTTTGTGGRRSLYGRRQRSFGIRFSVGKAGDRFRCLEVPASIRFRRPTGSLTQLRAASCSQRQRGTLLAATNAHRRERTASNVTPQWYGSAEALQRRADASRLPAAVRS
jgi:hypothetical protein